ncbi:MAG: helix-turn-helix transcriptional regulator [Candidatus Bathyarchaeia archaeon]
MFRKEESKVERTQPVASDRELIMQWVQSVNDSLMSIREELRKMPSETAIIFNQSLENQNGDVLRKLDELPDKITGPLNEMIVISKHEILAELVRISSDYNAHHSHDSDSAQVLKPLQEITNGLTSKQRRLLALFMDSGFLSYAEIGEKLGITHESAKNLVNRLLKDEEKARLFSKQETDRGVIVGVSSEAQDEILEKKYRTTANDST